MLTGSHGISRGDEVHSAWLFDSKVVALWVATEIVTKATTMKKRKKKKRKCCCTYLGPGGGEEVHLWFDCFPKSHRDTEKRR